MGELAESWARLATLVTALSCAASSAFGQVAASGTPAVGAWSATGVIGAGTVHDPGVLAGAEVIRRLSSRFGVVLDLAYARHVETTGDAAAADTIAAWLQRTRGQPATGHARSSALLAAGGFRYLLDVHRSWRPYVVGTGGVARVSAAASFRLGGADITSGLATYAVVLGPDLHGAETSATIGGGGGVLIPFGSLSLDVGYRLTSIRRSGGPANLNAVQVGIVW